MKMVCLLRCNIAKPDLAHPNYSFSEYSNKQIGYIHQCIHDNFIGNSIIYYDIHTLHVKSEHTLQMHAPVAPFPQGSTTYMLQLHPTPDIGP